MPQALVDKLSPRTIKGIKPPKVGREELPEGTVPGLSLRVSSEGTKTWMLRYRVHRRQRRETLGRYPAVSLAGARERALEIQNQVARGHDPAAERVRQREALTFDQLADLYLTRHAKVKKRTWATDARYLRVHCRRRWRNRLAESISAEEVRELLARVAAERGGVLANRLRACLSKVFNWARSESLVVTNPVAGLARPGKEQQRERVLTDDEIRALWRQLDEAAGVSASRGRRPGVREQHRLTPLQALWLRLRLLTAQRGGEVASMEWECLNLDRGVWEIPGSLTKNGRPHLVPLSSPAVRLLRDHREAQTDRCRYVFEGGRSRHARMGVTGCIDLPDFRPHDLRRTAATDMARLRVPRFVIGRILNHADPTVTGVYDRYEYFREKRNALERWGRELERIVGLPLREREKVVRINRRD